MAGVPVRCETSPVNSPWTVDGYRRRLVARLVEDLDLAGADDEEAEVAVADLDEHVTRGMLRDRCAGAAAELLDLLIGQGWKGNFVEIELRHGPWYTLSQNRTQRIPRPRYPRTRRPTRRGLE